jgi:hypothetical protein
LHIYTIRVKYFAMSLPDFIKKHGDEKCAVLFRSKLRTVGAWRRRERYPRPAKAQEMISVSGGELTMAGIFSDTPAKKEAA